MSITGLKEASMSKYKIISTILILTILLTGCATTQSSETAPSGTQSLLYFYENVIKMNSLLDEIQQLNFSSEHVSKFSEKGGHSAGYDLSEYKGRSFEELENLFDTNYAYKLLLYTSALTIKECGIQVGEADGSVVSANFRVETDLNNYDYYYEKVEKIAEDVRAKNLPDEAVVQYLADYISQLGDYDDNAKGKFESGNYNPWNIGGFFEDGLVVCEGYAKLFHILCDMLGIPVINVLDLSDPESPHMWNAVYVNDEWLMVDITSYDANISGVSEREQELIRSKFILVPTGAFIEYKFSESEFSEARDLTYPDLVGNEVFEIKDIGFPKELIGSNYSAPASKLTAAVALYLMDKPDFSDKTPRYNDVPDWAHTYVNYAVDSGYFKVADEHFGSGDVINGEIFSQLALKDKSRDENNLHLAIKEGLLRPARVARGDFNLSDLIVSIRDANQN